MMIECSTCRRCKVRQSSDIRFLFWNFSQNKVICCNCLENKDAFQSSYPLLFVLFADTQLFIAMTMRAFDYSRPKKRVLPPATRWRRHTEASLRKNELDSEIDVIKYQRSFLQKLLSSRAQLRKMSKHLNFELFNFNTGDIVFMNAYVESERKIECLKKESYFTTRSIIENGELVHKRHSSISYNDDQWASEWLY